jgi:uncharacterized protein (DUF983 family)
MTPPSERRERLDGRAIAEALGRGVRRRCPHCGRGRLFSGWAHHLDRCAICGLVFERNAGDTWLFTIVLDRAPVALFIVLIYFSVFRAHHVAGVVTFLVVGIAFVWTSPNRWGVGIALHYLTRVGWPDPADPIPPPFDDHPA